MGFSGTVHFGGTTANDSWLSVDISAVAFSIGTLEVRWYGIFIGLGMLLAVLYAYHYGKQFGVERERMIDVAVLGILIGVFGARMYYVIFNYDEFRNQPWTKIFMINEGGLGIYGGIILGMLSAWLLCRWRKIRLLPMLDLASIGFLIGQGLGRWGNFTNQEAFGTNTGLPWGMYSARTNSYLTMNRRALSEMGIHVNPTLPVHPCFLYESLWCLIGFLAIHFFFRKHRKYDGQIFLLYVLWYGLGRFWIEGLRTDSLMWGPYRISQFIAALCVIITVILLWSFRKHRSIFGAEGLELQLAAEAEAQELKMAEKAAKKAAKAGKQTEEKADAAPEQGEK